MYEVLKNIKTSLEINPRKVLVIYSNPNVIEQQKNLIKVADLDFSGLIFKVYSNTH